MDNVVLTNCDWIFQGKIFAESNIGCVRMMAAVRDNQVYWLK